MFLDLFSSQGSDTEILEHLVYISYALLVAGEEDGVVGHLEGEVVPARPGLPVQHQSPQWWLTLSRLPISGLHILQSWSFLSFDSNEESGLA